MAVASPSRLRQFREQMTPKITQEGMARQVGITHQWYRLIECGRNTSWTTANAILTALNAERMSRDLDPLNLEQLDLKIV